MTGARPVALSCRGLTRDQFHRALKYRQGIFQRMALAQFLSSAGDQKASLPPFSARIKLGDDEKRILETMPEDKKIGHGGAEANGVIAPFAGHDPVAVETEKPVKLGAREVKGWSFAPEVRKADNCVHRP